MVHLISMPTSIMLVQDTLALQLLIPLGPLAKTGECLDILMMMTLPHVAL